MATLTLGTVQSHIGTIVSVTRGDAVLDAELLEVRKGSAGEDDAVYCHYLDYDRRNDEWVPLHRISLLTHDEEDTKDEAVVGSASSAVTKHKRRLELSPEGGDRYRHQHHRGASSGHAMDPSLFALLEAEREDITKVKNIPTIQLGRWEIEAWYYSPYPKFVSGHSLYICEYTLKYTKNRAAWLQHRKQCKARSPPGKQIYEEGNVSLWEVDGSEQQVDLCCIFFFLKKQKKCMK